MPSNSDEPNLPIPLPPATGPLRGPGGATGIELTPEIIALCAAVWEAGHADGWRGNQRRRNPQGLDALSGWKAYVHQGGLSAAARAAQP